MKYKTLTFNPDFVYQDYILIYCVYHIQQRNVISMTYKKLVSFNIDETLIHQLDEIEKSYEIYIKEKDDYKTFDDKVKELYERIGYFDKEIDKLRKEGLIS